MYIPITKNKANTAENEQRRSNEKDQSHANNTEIKLAQNCQDNLIS